MESDEYLYNPIYDELDRYMQDIIEDYKEQENADA